MCFPPKIFPKKIYQTVVKRVINNTKVNTLLLIHQCRHTRKPFTISTHVMSLLGENMASKGEHTYPVKALWRHPYNWATVSVAAVNIYAAAWFFLKGPSFSAPRSRVAWILWKLFVGVRLTSLHSPLRPDTHSEGLCATRTLVVLVLASDRKPNFRLSPLYT